MLWRILMAGGAIYLAAKAFRGKPEASEFGDVDAGGNPLDAFRDQWEAARESFDGKSIRELSEVFKAFRADEQDRDRGD
jgi:hypothetical protein